MIVKIEFEEQIWAQIIDMLAEHPYKRSGAIINTMAQQIQEQRPPSQLQPQPSATRSGNGSKERASSIAPSATQA